MYGYGYGEVVGLEVGCWWEAFFFGFGVID